MKKYYYSGIAVAFAAVICVFALMLAEKESEGFKNITFTGDEILSVESLPVAINLGTFSKQTVHPTEIFNSYVSSVVSVNAKVSSAGYFSQPQTSSGTGFVIREDGYILTNYHVIENGNEINVILYDGSNCKATVVGYDKVEDIALIKIEKNSLTPVALGNSDELMVGEDIVVIGNPLGELNHSLTKGVVSALNRYVTMSDGSANTMIQIDASVNSGNSGGPAFDSAGKVVGVVTAKYSSVSVEGLGFCIPINDAMTIAEQLLEYGYVKGRPLLGISVKNIYNYSVKGVYVESVSGCTEKAGIMKGDIIVRINGIDVSNTNELEIEKNKYRAGDTISVTVIRGGEMKEFEVVLDEKSSV